MSFGIDRMTVRELIVLGLDDFLAPIIAVGTNMMTQMHFAGAGFYRQWRAGQKIMRAVHAAF